MSKLSWSLLDIFSNSSTSYTIDGSELDKQLVEAFLSYDKEKVSELLNQGANKNVNLRIEEKTNGDTIVNSGPLMQHLLCKKPIPVREVTRVARRSSSSAVTYNAKTSSFDRNQQALREKRALKLAQYNEIERTKKANNALADKIIDMFEYWLNIYKRIEIYPEDLSDIKIKKVRDYIERTWEVERIVLEKMKDLNLLKDGIIINARYYNMFIDKTKEYRMSSLSLDEIEETVQRDFSFVRSPSQEDEREM